ncbi:hypothetical protein IFM89_015967 [Coptis chinensis]|uniref:Uncharacterized protein n=1 Tax=Coptis chinensis TaxID=261450 RepID=A0A835HFE7_9MAGN|nr:hypothetical protein IFM89_015967 [Coptis chinensis]
MVRKRFPANFQRMLRLIKLFVFVGIISFLGILFAFHHLTVGGILVRLLAFMPTGWALLQARVILLQRGFQCLARLLENVVRGFCKEWIVCVVKLISQVLYGITFGLWGSVKSLSRGSEYIMGLLIFTPIATLTWFPFVSDFQTRLLFNQAFSRGLQISRILSGGKKQR